MLQTLGKAIIVCIVDFSMVFLVMAGLQAALAIMRRIIERFTPETAPSPIRAEIPEAQSAMLPTPGGQQPVIAAVTAAVHAFTGQPEGAIRIDYIEPLGEHPAAVSEAALLAAITASIQAFTNLPVGQFRIDSIQPLEALAMPSAPTVSPAILTTPQRRLTRVTTDAWKLAGRLELMGTDD
jgi:Na+-transporting methylmalonyl-CoA/oxaloacetate decarboxylase gamma subunit